MKILFFLDSPWDTHHAYIIDEIKIAIEDGHEVTLITCDAEFEACRFNPTGNKLSCGICKKYQKESVQLLPTTLITFPLKHFLTETDKKEIQSQQFTYNSVEDIKNLTFEGVDIGYGSFSTYIDFTRNLSPIFNKKFKKYFDKLLRSSLITLKGMRKAFKTIQPDKVVVRNGRHHQNRPLLRLAEQNNLIFDTLEHIIKNPNDVRKEIYHNSLPHGVRYNNDTALKNWNNSELSEEEKIQKGSSFFEKRINGE